MIEAKYFRLGNYVYGALGEICVIEQLGAPGNPNFVGYREIGTSINFGQNGQKPIPLDENILLNKCGFKKIKHKTAIKGVKITYYKLKKFVVYLLPDCFEIELLTKSGEQFNLFRTFKKELHILQNIYQLLENKELEVTL